MFFHYILGASTLAFLSMVSVTLNVSVRHTHTIGCFAPSSFKLLPSPPPHPLPLSSWAVDSRFTRPLTLPLCWPDVDFSTALCVAARHRFLPLLQWACSQWAWCKKKKRAANKVKGRSNEATQDEGFQQSSNLASCGKCSVFERRHEQGRDTRWEQHLVLAGTTYPIVVSHTLSFHISRGGAHFLWSQMSTNKSKCEESGAARVHSRQSCQEFRFGSTLSFPRTKTYNQIGYLFLTVIILRYFFMHQN